MDFSKDTGGHETAHAGVMPTGPADTIFFGGRVHVLDAGASTAEALAVVGDTIVAVGNDEEIRRFAGADTRLLDLAGRAMIPGINDAHLHGVWYGARWPKFLFDSPDGEWNGPPLQTRADRVKAIMTAWREMAALGITSYTEPGIGPGEDAGETGCFGSAVLDTYVELAGTEAQTVRVTLLRLFGLLDGASTLAAYERGLETRPPETDARWLSIPGVKIFADGIPPMRSAWTIAPYRDGSHGGLMTDTGSEAERLAAFRRMIALAHGRNLQVAVHATGDRTTEEFITAIEELGGAGKLRHYIIHGDLLNAGQMERMETARIGVALQPLIAEKTTDWLAQAVTEETAAQAFRFDRMVGTGLNAILSSDAPIASPDWRLIVASAARQLEQRGIPAGNETLTRLLRMYTAIPAVQDGAETWKGTLEAGKVADLCVLERDPYEAGIAALPAIAVDMTMVGGRMVYQRQPH